MRSLDRRRRKAGMVAGALVPQVAETKAFEVNQTIFHYDAASVSEMPLTTPDLITDLRSRGAVLWIDVNGVHEIGVLEKLGAAFNIHALVLEDIADISERPKVDDYEDYLFVTLKMVQPNDESPGFRSEQVSFVLGNNYLISFQEYREDLFNPVRERLRSAKGRIRKLGPDFLLYALLDCVVDGYFEVLEDLGEDLERIEEMLVKSSDPEAFRLLHEARRVALQLRRCAWPMREMLAALERGESDLISQATKLFIRDAYDHAVEIIDIIENSRDVCSSLLDVYLSSQSKRLNEVMKVLTIIATIFMPLSWIAGVYGMNFENMPELKLHYGYPASLALMGVIAVWMLFYFRRKGWI